MHKTDPFPAFHYLKYLLGALSALLATWLFFQLFFESIGGPFPQRTRGPLANEEFYRLGELPAWENTLPAEGSTLNRAEMLLEGYSMSPIDYVAPPASEIISPATPAPAAEVPPVTEIISATNP